MLLLNKLRLNLSVKHAAVCLILLCVTLNSIKAQPNLVFADAKKNFGFVKQGKKIELKFEFENKGNQPLILTDSKVACSCTEVILPKEPVLPQQKSTVTIVFDTNTVYDRQDRVVEIYSNAINNPQQIRFKGVVLRK